MANEWTCSARTRRTLHSALAERNPLREIPPYDDASEARLRELLASFGTGPTARRTRVWTSGAWVAATVGLVAVLVAGVVITSQARSSPPRHSATPPPARTIPSSPATSSSPAQRFPTADGSTPLDLIVYRSTIALNGADNFILQGTETQYTSPRHTYVSVDWQDQRDTTNFRDRELDSAGNPELDAFDFVENGTRVDRTLDYPTHTYTENPLILKHVPKGPILNQAQIIARDLKTGEDKVLGTSVINGATELHLSNDEPGMNREIWVDPTTYLPVRMTAHGSFGSYVIDYTWIPRTDQKVLEIFQPPIPAGFTKVTHPGGH